jgi:CRP/FNR family transcriptional regulator, cyclic AMP receptor protein
MGRSNAVSVAPAVLESIPLFAGLREEDRTRVAEVVDEVAVPEGAEIIHGRDFAYHFYAIVDGEAEVVKNGRTLATLGAGDVFGEIGMLYTGRRTATVIASRPTRLVAIFDREIRRLEAEVPPFSLQIRAAVGDRGWSTPA